MSEESDRLELPRNEEVAFEIIYDESTDGLVLSNGKGRFSFGQLVEDLQSLEGFKLQIKVTE
jgi:hypothetical protein